MGGRPLRITLTHEEARVPRRDRSLLEPFVTAPAVTFGADAGRVTGRHTAVTGGRVEGAEFVFPSKLAWSAAPTLWRRGVTVEFDEGLGRGRVPAPDTAHLHPAGPLARFFRLPWAKIGGLIRFTGAAHPDALVPDIVAAYPRRAVLVLTPNRSLTRKWVDRLRHDRPGRPVLDGRAYGDRPVGGPKVVVASHQHADMAQPDDFAVVVVPDARPLRGVPAALSSEGRPYRDYRMMRTWWVPAFGFIPAGTHQSPAERLALGALFGPEVRLGSDPEAAVEVRVADDPTAPTSGASDPGDDSHALRRAVWGNGPRTAWVAGLARAAAATSPGRVLVLADTAHAHALGAALNWPVIGHEHPGRAPDRAVVTTVWAAAQRPLAAAGLGDARGWGPLDVAGFPPRDSGPALLIDAGVAGPAGRLRTADRLAAYRRRGWTVTAPTGKR